MRLNCSTTSTLLTTDWLANVLCSGNDIPGMFRLKSADSAKGEMFASTSMGILGGGKKLADVCSDQNFERNCVKLRMI